MIMLAAQWPAGSADARPKPMPYTKERPLVIVSDWNFAPYEYSNDKGKPEGYNVELLKTILEELKVPYIFMIEETKQAVNMFEKGEADLMIEPFGGTYPYKTKPSYSRKTLAPYKIKIAYRRGTTPVSQLRNISENSKVVLKKYDYAAFAVTKHNDVNKQMLRYKSPKEALQDLNSGRYQYFIWGEMPLMRKLQELNLNDIELCDIDIPAGNMRFVSHDKQLIDELDEQFARLEQSGAIYKMQLKWFHPERNRNDASPLVVLVIIGVIVIAIIMMVANYIMSIRIKKRTQHIFEKNKIMQEALNKSDNCVVRLDLKRNMAYNIHGKHLPEEGMARQQYLTKIHRDDRESTTKFTKDLIDGKNENEGHVYRYNAGTEEQPEWRVIYIHSITEVDRNGKVRNIISTLTDITTENANEERDMELTAKYSQIFEKAIIGLSLYDKDGRLLNSNKKMRQLLKFKETKDSFYYDKCLFNLEDIKNSIENGRMRETHFCTKADFHERGVSEYMEIRIRPIENDEGELVYILVSARSIEEERKLYLQRKENNEVLQKVNRKIARSENELQYLLNKSDMRVWHSSFESREITFHKDLRDYETKISFDDMTAGTFSDEDRAIVGSFIEPVQGNIPPKTIIIKVKDLFTGSGERRWYSINRIPEHGSDGKVTGCFGLIRDVTKLMEAQEKLREETVRANKSEQQKSVFLANMSHEIRTPLNAIIGFCDLMQSVENPEDRKEFARIIQNNCEMLKHLINDILMISTINSDGFAIRPRPVDFSAAFDDVCATLAQQAGYSGIEFIKDNPYSSFQTELDTERIQQVIINFATNAIKHTRRGYVKVGYRAEDGGIRIFCEDTGEGIPKDRCEDVFKRFVKLNEFVQGTGLGLNICKAIADSCGGRIGVESELGKGSYFWMWIPCPTNNIRTLK